MRQLSRLTHRTSIRFCTQSCERIKRVDCRWYSLRDVSIGIADRSPTSSSTYCLPDPRGWPFSKITFRGIRCFAHSRKPFVVARICCTSPIIASGNGSLRLTLNNSPRYNKVFQSFRIKRERVRKKKDRKEVPQYCYLLNHIYLLPCICIRT